MTKRNNKNQSMVRLALFLALEVLLAVTPLGYIHVGLLEISLLMLPVAVGGILLGPAAGAFLGGVFGVTSFLQCFGTSVLGAALLAISPFRTFLLCVPTRVLAGWLPALLYRTLTRQLAHGVRRMPAMALACLLSALLNTLLFMGCLVALFGSSEAVGFAASGMGVFAFILASVGVNAAVELPGVTILGTVISQALEAVLNPGQV